MHGAFSTKWLQAWHFAHIAACKASAHLTKWRDQKQARQEILRGSPPSALWIWCSEKHYWADSERTRRAVSLSVTYLFLTIVLVSLSVSLFFSPLSLRRGVVVVCFEVYIGELLAPCDLGDPGWGDLQIQFLKLPPLRYLPEGPLTDWLGAVVWKARELDFRSWYCGRQGGKFK